MKLNFVPRSIWHGQLCWVFFALFAFSRVIAGTTGTLETPTFTVKIDVRCEEGEVTCDDVKYVGTNKKTGESLALTGKTVHHMAPDGTPGRFLGYLFKNKGVTYFVSEEGLLRITKGDDVLLEENGTWTWDDASGQTADKHKDHDSQKKE